MLWMFMILSLFRFDGDLGGTGLNRGAGGSLQANDGMTGIPPKATPNSAYKALDGMTGIPPR